MTKKELEIRVEELEGKLKSCKKILLNLYSYKKEEVETEMD